MSRLPTWMRCSTGWRTRERACAAWPLGQQSWLEAHRAAAPAPAAGTGSVTRPRRWCRGRWRTLRHWWPATACSERFINLLPNLGQMLITAVLLPVHQSAENSVLTQR